MTTIQTEAQALAPTARVELFVLDLSIHNAGILYFCSTSNPLGGDVIWQGVTYTAMPVEGSGFERRNNGTLPRPTLKVSNYQGLMAAQAREAGGLIGCTVTRKRTFARFLDAANFAGGNPSADSSQQYPDETWRVDRKANETPQYVEFELAATIDVPGVQLPLRQYINGVCAWVYRGESCGYTGGPVALEDGTATSDPLLDRCGKKLSDCRLRGNEPRYGGFPGSGLMRG
ncbi:phage minor tail protein L [Brachymonas sp.]|uniref:phage minor tail protein L n=1 Tax=Brachymonas sp. TaxID=1936292 RepID=UPI0035AD7993